MRRCWLVGLAGVGEPGIFWEQGEVLWLEDRRLGLGTEGEAKEET